MDMVILKKVLHFLLFGAVTFWLNLWLNGRTLRFGRLAIPLAILIPLSVAAGEEGLQALSPLRTASIFDLMSDLAGMYCAWWLSIFVFRASNRAINLHTVDKKAH
ncbi:VanZ family protein [Chloroflexi bacterium TSY]|nr:VanZ family protein [Chloroflexi bacterium TSY]